MEKFITNNWLAIIGVLCAIIVCLIVAWVVMDRKDKKLIAEYKAQIKAAKEESDKPAEKVAEEEKPAKAPAKKAPAKTSTAKKPAAKTTTAKKTTKK